MRLGLQLWPVYPSEYGNHFDLADAEDIAAIGLLGEVVLPQVAEL